MIIIEGAHLTRDPQRHEGRNGDFLTFGVAENHRRRDGDGNWIEDGTTYYDVTVGGRTNLIDNVEASLSKGAWWLRAVGLHLLGAPVVSDTKDREAIVAKLKVER